MNAEFDFWYFTLSAANGISASHEDNKNTPNRKKVIILRL
jgi:hypothetical protein